MLLVVASMAVVIGCGSSDDSSGSDITTAEFISQADEICSKSDAEIEAMGEKLDADATQADTLALVKSDLIPAVEKRAQDLEALPRPADDADELEAYFQSLDDGVSTLVDDPESIFGETNAFEDSNKLAKEYGLKTCGTTGGG
jgi:hypothetical protein